MLVSQSRQLVFVSTPKCATNTIYDVLTRLFGDAQYVQPQFHNRHVPPRYQGYFTFSVVRNPYARAVSLWYSTTVNPDNRRYCYRAIGTTDFTTFLRYLLTRPVALVKRHLDRNQTDWLAPVRLDAVLRLESLGTALRGLPFWPPGTALELPQLNASVGCPTWQSVMTAERITLINRWANDDFDRFGYRRLDPTQG